MASTSVVESPKRDMARVGLAAAVRSKTLLLTWVAVIVGVVVGYLPAFGFWWSRWFEKDSYYSHGPFVPIGSGVVIWFSRAALSRVNLKPSAWGFALAVPAAALGWLAWMGASASVMGFTFPLFLLGAVIATLGVEAARRLAFPILFLYFAAAPPEYVLTVSSFKLQMLSTKMAAASLRLLGLQAHSMGAFIDVNGFTVAVGAACSGFRLLVSMFAIAVFLAYVRRGPWWGKAALVAFVAPLSVGINSMRIMALSLVGRVWGESALRAAHDWTGYALLLVTAGALLLFARIVGCGNYKKAPLQ